MKGIIIFVDDEYYVLQTLKAVFRRELRDYQKEFFERASEALEFLDQKSAQVTELKLLVLSDWYMPMMRGDQFLEQVKLKFPTSKNFLLSGMINREPDPEVFAKSGIIKLISKPWDNEELIHIIKNALEDQ